MRRIGMMAAGTAALALMLAGCNDRQASDPGNSAAALPPLPSAVPMQPGPETRLADAPPPTELPSSGPVRTAALASPDQGYAYLDRAYGVTSAFGDSPPDYAFDYDGVSPWAWQSDDGAREYVEPVSDGYRYYYYEPGAGSPYLVRDPDYSYAYAGAALVGIYAASGAFLPRDQWGYRADYGARYFDRGDALWRAAREREHRGVVAANWAARRATISAAQAQWSAARAQQAAWTSYHDAHAAQERAHWDDEHARRAAVAQRFADWQHQDFRGPAPQFGRQGDGPRGGPGGGPEMAHGGPQQQGAPQGLMQAGPGDHHGAALLAGGAVAAGAAGLAAHSAWAAHRAGQAARGAAHGAPNGMLHGPQRFGGAQGHAPQRVAQAPAAAHGHGGWNRARPGAMTRPAWHASTLRTQFHAAPGHGGAPHPAWSGGGQQGAGQHFGGQHPGGQHFGAQAGHASFAHAAPRPFSHPAMQTHAVSAPHMSAPHPMAAPHMSAPAMHGPAGGGGFHGGGGGGHGGGGGPHGGGGRHG